MDYKKRDHSTRVAVIAGFGLLSILIGFILTPSMQQIKEGFLNIIFHHSLSDTDFFYIAGNIGTPFIHSGILVLLVVIVFELTKTEFSGKATAGIMLIYGFSFYGKTIYNMWPLMIGVYIHAFLNKAPLSSATPTACFATALGPLVSVLSFHKDVFGNGLGTWLDISNAMLIGLIAGYLIAMLASHVMKLHDGNMLYNVGYTVGIVGFLFNSVFRAIGQSHDAYLNPPYISQEYRMLLMGVMALFYLYFAVTGIFLNRGMGSAKKLLGHFIDHEDFVDTFGFNAAITNLGVLGLTTVAYFFIMPYSEVHGLVYAASFTVAGFAMCGMTLRGVLPLILGVFLGAFCTGGIMAAIVGEPVIRGGLMKASSRAMLNAAFLGCGLSPVTYRYGDRSAILGGILHSILVPNVAMLHGWTNVYNNGWGIGLLVTFFMPILKAVSAKRSKENTAVDE